MKEDYQKILENFAFIIVDKVDKEKIIFKFDSTNEHYTLHFGTKSRILDLHKTIELPDNKKNYETIIKINYFTIGRVLVKLKSIVNILEPLFFSNKVNPGFLRRKKFLVQTLDENDIIELQLVDYNEKKGRLKLGKNIQNANTINSLFNSKIDFNLKAAPYLLWQIKKNNIRHGGLLFVFCNESGNKQFYFVSRKTYNSFIKIVFSKVLEAIQGQVNQTENNIYEELKNLYDWKYCNFIKR